MKNINWIFFTSFRYLKNRRATKRIGPAALSIAGISIGVMALVSVLGIMNGFQLGFIEDIININSFHIRVYSDQTEPDSDVLNVLQNIDGVKSILPFMDIQTLVKGSYSDYEAVNIRAVPENLMDYDPALVNQLNLQTGDINLKESNSIIIGTQLAARLGTGLNDVISLVSMKGSGFRNLEPSDNVFYVTGLFKSGYYNFDRSMGFTNLNTSRSLASGKENIIYGIKLENKYRDKDISLLIKEQLGEKYEVVSWRDFNSAFFGALRTEKIAMMLVIGLIFIVVGVNIKHSLERSLVEKKEEIAILMSLGANSTSVKIIFIFEGFLIGLSGAVIGLIMGFLITENINSIFSGINYLITNIELFVRFLIIPLNVNNTDVFSMSLTDNFYITELPVRIIYSEVMLVFLFAIFASTWAAYSASKLISRYRPSEVLRYE